MKVLYKLVDAQDFLNNIYYQIFDNTIISVKAYSRHECVILHHVAFSFIYPIRYMKCYDIIYESDVILEIVHTKKKKTVITIIPSENILSKSSKMIIDDIHRLIPKQISILSFSLNNRSLINTFNKLSHSFSMNHITTNVFTRYIINKYRLSFNRPFILEIIGNDFTEHIFKEDDRIEFNE